MTKVDRRLPFTQDLPMRSLLSLLLLAAPFPLLSAADPAPAAPPLTWPEGKVDTWQGHTRRWFEVAGCPAWVVEPKQARPGHPWSWSLEFPDAFTARCAIPQLLAAGLHHVHIRVGNTFGSPAAQDQFDAFYRELTSRGLAPRAVLIGLSRGGLYAHRWAARHPDRVAVLYGDGAVCDFKSWPGGKGIGKGSAKDWADLIRLYGFRDEAEALAWPGNPVDQLAPLAAAQVPLIHVVGEADDVVPPAENADRVEAEYRRLGGVITVLRKPGGRHHPHGLDDCTPVVDFILRHLDARPASPPPP
jgi:pimeloyl-ACP methyl ester carboxylesterase